LITGLSSIVDSNFDKVADFYISTLSFRLDEELVKVAELKKIEQGGRMIEEFVQDFK